MKVSFDKYLIVTKEKPIRFMDYSAYETDQIQDAMLYDSEEEATGILKELDFPDDFEILPVNITYEL